MDLQAFGKAFDGAVDGSIGMMTKGIKGAAAIAVVAAGLSGIGALADGLSNVFKGDYSHCEHDGDGGALLIRHDGTEVAGRAWTIDFDRENCHTGTNPPESLELRSNNGGDAIGRMVTRFDM